MLRHSRPPPFSMHSSARKVPRPTCIAACIVTVSPQGHQPIVEALLSASAHVDAASSTGCTSLMAASQNGHAKVAYLLVAAKAEPNTAKHNGGTALIGIHTDLALCCALCCHLKSSSVHLSQAAMVVGASQQGHRDVVDVLIRAHANVNYEAPPNGGTALFVGAQNGHLAVVNRLLSAGAKAPASISLQAPRRW